MTGPKNLDRPRRQRDGAAELRPHHRLGEQAETLPAIFDRHVVAGQPERLRLVLQARLDGRVHAVADPRAHLDRDHLGIDEAADLLLEQAQLGRELEVHCGVGGASHRWVRR
jgi:hypothetical protein